MHLLTLDFEAIEGILGYSNRYVFLPSDEAFPSLRMLVAASAREDSQTHAFGEVVQWHTHLPSILDVRLVSLVVQLGLDSRWEDLNHFNVTRFQRGSQTQYPMMKRRLCCAVVGPRGHRKQTEIR